MTAADVAAHTERLRARWAKSVPALTSVREEVMEILREHGGIMGGRGLAAGLLARRGSLLGDPAERLRVAAICVRAAVDTEERREKPRLARSRGGAAGTVIIALTEAAAEDGSPAPRADDLFAYAELLGDQADVLAARDPLPGVTEIKQALRDVMIKLTLGEADTRRPPALAVRHRPGPARRRRVGASPPRPPALSCIRATCRPNAH